MLLVLGKRGRRPVLLVLTLAAWLGPSGAGRAETLATVSARTPVTAGEGYVAWSVLAQGRWRLQLWHAGRVSTPDVASRPAPFDADIGTDRRGRPVVTYSRCVSTPPVGYNGQPSVWKGWGCRLRVYDLRTREERALHVGRNATGSSDQTPSMWRGRIAFGRLTPGPEAVSRLMLSIPGKAKLRVLRHGAVKPCVFVIAGRCDTSGPDGPATIEGLDLSARGAAYLWYVNQSLWEVRRSPLDGSASELIGQGFIGEACTGGTDLSQPSTPSFEDGRVWYSQLSLDCYQPTSLLVRAPIGAEAPARFQRGPLDGAVLEHARLTGSDVVLVTPDPVGPGTAFCVTEGPCTIEKLPTPALQSFSSNIGDAG